MKNKLTVYSIGKKFSGHGHYEITFEYSENGIYNPIKSKTERFTTTNMQLIDEWDDNGAEALVEHHLKYDMQIIEEDEKVSFDF